MYRGIMFTADMHLRDTVPQCRTDDFVQAQWDKLKFVASIATSENLAWIDAGDLFHTAKPSHKLLTDFIGRMNTWGAHIDAMVLGNHDLPSHNIGRVDESGVGVCLAAGVVKKLLNSDGRRFDFNNCSIVVYGASYTEEIPLPTSAGDNYHHNFLVMHEMVFRNRANSIPGVQGFMGKQLLKDHPDYSIIVSGHNHKSFQCHLEKRELFNVGCLTRQAADYDSHIPSVLIWRPGSELEFMDVPHEECVVSRQHIDKAEQKEEELNTFVKSLQNVDEVSLSFQHNVNRVIEETKPEKPVKEKVREAME